MKNLTNLKKEKDKRFNDLINECQMFFAFSDEQFAKNKTPLQEGEKYVALGAGAYMPKSNVDKWHNGSKKINYARHT